MTGWWRGSAFQGISDQIAEQYLEDYGSVTWQDIVANLARRTPCRKLQSYWHFADCGFQKGKQTCGVQELLDRAPSPLTHCATDVSTRPPTRCSCSCATLPMATWSAGLMPSWSKRKMNQQTSRERLIEPLLAIYGVSHKMLSLAFSTLNV
jgi:hypothetical protein